MRYPGIREEAVKKKVAQDFFEKFDTTDILKNVDFAVKFRSKSGATLLGDEYLLWAEAKDGSADTLDSLTQLVLTIGQSGTVAKDILPPPFLGAFDSEKIAFIPYIDIADVFTTNDFNWKVTPSNHKTDEFRKLRDVVARAIGEKLYLYDFEKDETELRHFIGKNLPAGRTGGKVQITKNNFIHIYLRWLDEVKPHIAFNWDAGKKEGILDCDFYRADLFVDDKNTENIEDDTAITDKLSVVFRGGEYKIVTKVWGDDSEVSKKFKPGGKERYTAFWKKYKRPPLREYWDYIIDRRDLLVPQDIRERKGSFFTPQKWVALSQQYIVDVLGEDWQDEYTVWDCAAGTGNLLVGLTNKYNVWASTLDKADVDVMHERIDGGADLLHDHVFQFDFLNDEFSPVSKGGKLPDGLYEIINDPEKRRKLVVYINPPYAETATKDVLDKNRINKRGVSFTKTQENYSNTIGIATKELFAQFLARISDEISGSVLAQFSKLKIVQGPNFSKFRDFFHADFLKGFVCPANTFDNVKGEFPIGFMIWNLNGVNKIDKIDCGIFDKDAEPLGHKTFYAYDESVFITDWFRKYHTRVISNKNIAAIGLYGSDFQHNNFIYITSCNEHPNRWTFITANNLLPAAVYFAVRKVIPADWLNDRDQFLYPNDGWQTDTEFQNDCLAYTLFNNNIQSAHGENNWIPFTEREVNAHDKFASNFMTDFMAGKVRREQSANLFSDAVPQDKPTKLDFSPAAYAVFDAGRELWRYYHAQPDCNVNASLYDIREHFQGRNDKGKMNNRSSDERYNELISSLRAALKTLARKIEPKVYEYGFLK